MRARSIAGAAFSMTGAPFLVLAAPPLRTMPNDSSAASSSPRGGPGLPALSWARTMRDSAVRDLLIMYNPRRAGSGSCPPPRRLLEDVLREKVQVGGPLRVVVGMPVDVPDVRHAILLEVIVHAAADADQSVLVAGREPDQLQLPGNRRIGHEN